MRENGDLVLLRDLYRLDRSDTEEKKNDQVMTCSNQDGEGNRVKILKLERFSKKRKNYY